MNNCPDWYRNISLICRKECPDWCGNTLLCMRGWHDRWGLFLHFHDELLGLGKEYYVIHMR
jgi:hypothetical protein